MIQTVLSNFKLKETYNVSDAFNVLMDAYRTNFFEEMETHF